MGVATLSQSGEVCSSGEEGPWSINLQGLQGPLAEAMDGGATHSVQTHGVETVQEHIPMDTIHQESHGRANKLMLDNCLGIDGIDQVLLDESLKQRSSDLPQSRGDDGLASLRLSLQVVTNVWDVVGHLLCLCDEPQSREELNFDRLEPLGAARLKAHCPYFDVDGKG